MFLLKTFKLRSSRLLEISRILDSISDIFSGNRRVAEYFPVVIYLEFNCRFDAYDHSKIYIREACP